MSKHIRRFVSLILTGVLAVSSLTGCGPRKDTETQNDENKSGAMGRYLESDIPLPENVTMVYNMRQMEDGSIHLAAMEREGLPSVWELKDDGKSWEKLYDFDADSVKEGKYARVAVSALALSPKGDALAAAYLGNEEDETGDDYKRKYYHINESGDVTDVPYETDSYSYFLQSGDDGDFYMAEGDFSIKRVNAETGEAEIILDGETNSRMYGIAGSILYSVAKDGAVTSYDLESNELLPRDEGLNESIKENKINASIFSTDSMPLVFAGAEDENTVFYGGNTGVFRHVKGGSISEKLIDGALTSLANPDLRFIAMEVMEDESIYILATGTAGNKLMKYTYSPDTPTVPEKELKAYTLYENPELLQAIAMYQKDNPDIYVKLDVGVTEENGVTVSDALRTLSTEIMAGNGPDLLLLDGMPLDSYIEKGMLEDVTAIVNEVDEEEGLFTNITSAFEDDRKIYAVPLRFHMPVLEGQKESLENVKDLTSLADEAERLHAEAPDKSVINHNFNGAEIATQLYDVCSAAWINGDGTVDEEKLQEFYTQLKRIYTIDERSNEENTYVRTFIQSASSITAGTMHMYCDKSNINFGNISTAEDLAHLTTTLADKKEIGYDLLKGQTENTFLPACIAGINSKGKAVEEAASFLKFLLSKSAQSTNQGNGMPVNEQGMEAHVLDSSFDEYRVGTGGIDDGTYVEIALRNITEADYQSYLKKVEKLEIPALTNAIIQDAVLEQVNDCVTGTISVDDAVKKVVEKVNLYLAEG